MLVMIVLLNIHTNVIDLIQRIQFANNVLKEKRTAAWIVTKHAKIAIQFLHHTNAIEQIQMFLNVKNVQSEKKVAI